MSDHRTFTGWPELRAFADGLEIGNVYRDFLEVEESAVGLTGVYRMCLPRSLQSRAMAATTIKHHTRNRRNQLDKGEIDRQADLRTGRTALISAEGRPEQLYVDERTLTAIGGAALVTENLKHIVKQVEESRGKIELRIIREDVSAEMPADSERRNLSAQWLPDGGLASFDEVDESDPRFTTLPPDMLPRAFDEALAVADMLALPHDASLALVRGMAGLPQV